MSPWILAVMGPTASGKSELAETLADRFEAELISADAFQIYRGLDIGTGKPTRRNGYHLLDIRNPNESYSAGQFRQDALDVIQGTDRPVIVVGGTGLYVRVLLEPYTDIRAAASPELKALILRRYEAEGLAAMANWLSERDATVVSKVDLKNPARVLRALERTFLPPVPVPSLPPVPTMKIAVIPTPETTRERITQRVSEMMYHGWQGEVERLLDHGYSEQDPAFRAIGYREIARLIRGEGTLSNVQAEIVEETVRYAKKQRTWLRSEPRLNVLNPGDEPLAQTQAIIHAMTSLK